MRPLTLAAALILALPTFAIMAEPAAATTALTETFDNYTDGYKPCTPQTFVPPCTMGTDWNYAEAGSQTVNVQSTVFDGGSGKALKLQTGSGSGVDIRGGNDICSDGISLAFAMTANMGANSASARFVLSSNAYGTALTGSSEVYAIAMTTDASNVLTATLTLSHIVNNAGSNTASTPLTLRAGGSVVPANTWFHLTLACPTGNAGGTAVLFSPEALALGTGSTQVTVSANAGTSFNTNNHLQLTHNAAVAGIFVDNLVLGEVTNLSSVWCSDPGATNFGYDYKEDVSKESSGNAGFWGGNPAYFLEGDDTDFAYLGLYLGSASGSKHLKTIARIEAGTDGEDSVFRIVYGFTNLVPSSGNKGDGGYPTGTGAFASYVDAYFEEFGDTWRITMNERTVGGGSLTQLGASLLQGTANDRHTYTLEIDMTPASPVLILSYEGTVIMTREMNHVQNTAVRTQWFVGYGTGAVFNAETALAQADQGSTCVYDLSGTSSFTTPGSDPDSVLPTTTATSSSTATAGSGLPGIDTADFSAQLGIATEAGGWLIGLFLIVALAGGLYAFKPALGVLGGLLGIGMSVAFGLIPVWFLLVLVLLGAALVVTRFKGASA